MNLVPFLSRDVKSEAINKRISNIQFIYSINRDDLVYGENERQMLFANYIKNEYVSIQYPGKEASPNVRFIRPFDFRPKLRLTDGSYLNDLSFNDIWDCLFDLFESSNDSELLKLLACEFYRIAFMIDYTCIDTKSGSFDVFNVSCNDEYTYTHVNTSPMYVYTPNSFIVDRLKEFSPTILGASWESFFMYNDLLALNEDCKYFFNALTKTNDSDFAKKYIRKGTGRSNTMLSHISVLAVMLRELRLTKLLQSFARQRGVAPMTDRDLNAFLEDYMY